MVAMDNMNGGGIAAAMAADSMGAQHRAWYESTFHSHSATAGGVSGGGGDGGASAEAASTDAYLKGQSTTYFGAYPNMSQGKKKSTGEISKENKTNPEMRQCMQKSFKLKLFVSIFCSSRFTDAAGSPQCFYRI